MPDVLCEEVLCTYHVRKVVLEQEGERTDCQHSYSLSAVNVTWLHVTGLNSPRSFLLVAFFLAFLCIESGVTYLPPGVEFMPYSELKEPYFFM